MINRVDQDQVAHYTIAESWDLLEQFVKQSSIFHNLYLN